MRFFEEHLHIRVPEQLVLAADGEARRMGLTLSEFFVWCALRVLSSEPVTGFGVSSNMPFQAGATAVIDFTPQPAGAKVVSAPTITSSDPTNAPVTEDATGLIATVVFPESATVGESVTISISYTNPDRDVATGEFTDTIAAAPAPDVTGFTGTLVS